MKKNNSKSTPTHFVRFINDVRCLFFALLVLFVALGISACNTDNDYKKFVEYQARHETEKELVVLLKAYNDIYIENKAILDSRQDVQVDIKLIFENEIIATYKNFVLIDTNSNDVLFKLDDTATKIFGQITANNIGKTVVLVLEKDGVSIDINLSISYAIINGTFLVSNILLDNHQLLSILQVKVVENRLALAAENYNVKKKLYTSSVEYLPTSIPLPPQIADVSSYLEKANNMGYNIT